MKVIEKDRNGGGSLLAFSAQSESARRGTGAENGQCGMVGQAQDLPLEEPLILAGIFEKREDWCKII